MTSEDKTIAVLIAFAMLSLVACIGIAAYVEVHKQCAKCEENAK